MAVAAVAVASAPLSAQTTWSFTTNSATDGCTLTSGVGNVATCDAAGSSTAKVRVYGFGLGSTADQATVSLYSGNGLGVCNSTELNPYCSSSNPPEHTISNNTSRDDFVVLKFEQAVVLNTVYLGFSYRDADFSVLRWTGASDPLEWIVGKTGAQLTASGYWQGVGSYEGTIAAAGNATGATASQASQYWMVSAYNPNLLSSQQQGIYAGDDYFKLSGVKATSVVPEPSTYALMSAGLLGIFAAARRRRQA